MEQHNEGAIAPAAIYTRISKDLTLGGLGVARQLKDCRAMAERNGWQVISEFEDNDVSATAATLGLPTFNSKPSWRYTGPIPPGLVKLSASRITVLESFLRRPGPAVSRS